MGVGRNPLRTQRWLLAGLVALMGTSAFFLWRLPSGPGRGKNGGPVSPESIAKLDRARSVIAPSEAPLPEESGETARPEVRTRVETDAALRAPEPDSFDPGSFTGRVLAHGVPVSDVELRIFPGDLDRRERTLPLQQTKSDGEGRFRLTGLTPFVRYALHAQHPNHLPEEKSVHAGHAEDVELEPSATVSGTVRSAADRRPMEGVEVALERWHFAPAGPAERVSARSDAEGRWELPWAEPGIERFLVLRAGLAPERREFQVASEGGDGYEILLDSGARLELELFELESGTLLADTEILADGLPVRTDARGHLGLPIPLGTQEGLRISLSWPDGCQTNGRIDPDSVQGVLRVPLVRGGRVRGRVVDAHGAGVANARLRLGGGGDLPSSVKLPAGFWLSPSGERPRSRADGTFLVSGMPPRTERLELRAQHPEYPDGRSERFDFSALGAEVELEIVLAEGATVVGRVRLDGEPASSRVYWTANRSSGWTRANDRGDYRVAGLPEGEVTLRARLDDEDEDVPRPEDVMLVAAEGASLQADFDLVSRRVRIRGRVLDTQGLPVAGAEVWAGLTEELEEQEDWMDTFPEAESDEEGRFELFVPDAPGLRFDVYAELGPRLAEVRAVRAGQEVELVLPALATVLLRVLDAVERKPVPSFQLFWRPSEEGRFERLNQGGRRLSPGPDGTFLAELPCGTLDLAASARALNLVCARHEGVVVAANSRPTLEFLMEPGFELEVAFQIPPERADVRDYLRRARLALASEEQWKDRGRGGALYQEEVRNTQALRVDEQGRARLRGLASGSYRLTNVPRGYGFRPARFELPPVALHRVTLTFESTAKPNEADD